MMFEKFQAYINRCNLLAEGEKVILALSGGIDSMVLADLLLKSKVDFVVAHCNFQLRGEESDGDERFVREFAEKNGIQCFVKHFETEQYAAEQGVSIEMAARDLRYAWFEELRRQLNYDKIVVAHHADDQAETFFINLLRGAGLNGLKGMKPQNGAIIRPLLWVSREEIHQYAIVNQIRWREDHTNAESVYLRNKIRNQLLPVFDELQPEARQGLYKSLAHLSSENELYRELLKEKLSRIIECDGEIQCIPYSAFRIPHSAFQLLFEWLRQYGFNADQCRFIFDAMETGIGNKYYSPTHQIVIGRNELQLSEIKSVADKEIQIGAGEECIEEPIKLQFSTIGKTVDFVVNKSANVAMLDADKIRFPIVLRHWRRGDRFHPLGMKGSKLLSDFFVDQKFTDAQKESVWILTTSENEILWVVGHRIDDRFKVTPQTKSVFRCLWER